jgi:hypothetical protein
VGALAVPDFTVSQNIIRENNMPLDFMKFANEVFEGTKYQASDTDIQKLSSNTRILEDKGMTKLNRRLLEGGAKNLGYVCRA